MTEAVVVLVMAPSQAVAMAIARTVVGEGLVAAANVLSEASSIFRWHGELREVAEVPVLLKTHASWCEALMARAGELHPYEVPGIVAMPVAAAPASWLAWLGEVTQKRA